jgi:ribosomal protein L24
MRLNKFHFAFVQKKLSKWKFQVGDEVMVKVGRRPDAPERPGYKGVTGCITKIIKDPRCPQVHIEGVTVREHSFYMPSQCTGSCEQVDVYQRSAWSLD